MIISALFPKAYFKIRHSTHNGTYHAVRTLQKGETEIDGELATIIREVTKHPDNVYDGIYVDKFYYFLVKM